jgi:hypothetical protein
MFSEKAQAEGQRLAELAVHNGYNTFVRGFEAGYCFGDREGSLLMWDELQRVKARSQILIEAINQIVAKRGMCIFGSSDTSGDPEVAFRQGSAYSFSECADIAKEALAKYSDTEKQPKETR